MNKKKVLGLIAIPLVLATLFSGFKYGFINPMIKGLDIQIYGGTFITNLNKYVIKVGDKVGLSTGKYIVVPAFSKKPNLKFIILDDNGVLKLDKNNLIANKVGYSSIGILNKNRVLKKATIMVVNPTIKNMEFNLSNPITHVGDKAKIIGNVQIENYKKLEKGYKLIYKSSNSNILKVNKNYVEAVGIGDVKLIAKYDRQEIQTRLKILPKIENIELDKIYELEQNQNIQIHPNINTLPKNSKVNIKYTIVDNDDNKKINNGYDDNKKVILSNKGPIINYGITIDKNGIVKANRVGKYLVKVSAENKYKYTIIDVKPPSFKNLDINYLQYSLYKKDNTTFIELGWDYNNLIKYYNVYISKNDEPYQLIDQKYVRSKPYYNNRVSDVININRDLDSTYKIYIVGSKTKSVNSELTKRSKIITINKESDIFANTEVKSIQYKVDKENNTLFFTWDKINKCTYRIYRKNKTKNGDVYTLLLNNIKENNTVIKIYDDQVNADFYIVAISPDGQISNFKNYVNVNVNFPY